MKQNLITYTFLKDKSGKIKTEYDFEKNCWIIKNDVSISQAIQIAKILKKKYYKNKQWLISGNYEKTIVRFIDEMEHF